MVQTISNVTIETEPITEKTVRLHTFTKQTNSLMISKLLTNANVKNYIEVLRANRMPRWMNMGRLKNTLDLGVLFIRGDLLNETWNCRNYSEY